jgi:hypothetical protein
VTADRRAWRWVVQGLVVLAGLGALVWAIMAPVPPIRCHDQVMRPGDVCSYSSLAGEDNGRTQTYEQRVATEKSARPVVGVVGAAVAGFGGVLLWQSVRRRRVTR